MKLFRKVMSGLLAGSLILSLVACGAGPGATETGDPSGNGAVGTPSASGDEIVVNVSDNVTLINLEVYANNNSCEFLYADLVFDPLYYGDRQGNNSPCICTSYDLNEDGTEVTLHIKEGVKFHDGTDLNAEDVVATFEFMLRNMDTLGLASAVWSNLESVELIDEYTCKITLSQYFATFENSLTYTWILSDEDIEQYGDDFQSAERVINGSGPWKFVEWQDGQYARYTPNQNYWDPDAVSNIDTLNVWFVNQENAKVSGITSGNLDYTQSLRSDMVPLVENLEGVEVIEYTSDVMYYMQFDCAEDSIFSDPNARKAAAYALDVNTVLGLVGGGEKMNCMFLPSLLGYDESIEGYEYNPDLAREYLAKTDYNGEKLTLYTRNDLVAIDDVMAVFIQNLVDVGFNISTKICDSAEFVTIRQDPSAYDIFFVNLGAFDADPYPEISEQYHDARVMYMNDGIVLEIQQMAEETGCPIDETTLEPLVYKTYLDALSRKGMEVFRARRELARAGREMGRFFQSYDLLISPTCGRIGRPLGTLNGVVNSEISASEWARKRRDYACIAPLANVAGLPSISLPLYMSDSGLPIGVEIDGAIDQDELVLQLSAQLERAAPWSERKPPIYVSEI